MNQARFALRIVAGILVLQLKVSSRPNVRQEEEEFKARYLALENRNYYPPFPGGGGAS
jgi:hypothetical protein